MAALSPLPPGELARKGVHMAVGGIAFAMRFLGPLGSAACALGAVLWLRPPLLWAALIVTMIGLVLAAELVNTALERTLDGLHAEHAEFVRIAKDCAAAAVLVLSATAAFVFLLMIIALVL